MVCSDLHPASTQSQPAARPEAPKHINREAALGCWLWGAGGGGVPTAALTVRAAPGHVAQSMPQALCGPSGRSISREAFARSGCGLCTTRGPCTAYLVGRTPSPTPAGETEAPRA